MDGVVCETSFDCGGALKCVEGVCRDPFAPPPETQTEELAPHTTIGHRMMFGTGDGYSVVIALMDVVATAVEPILLYGAGKQSGEPQTILGILCFVPVGFTGSITHFAHGRVVPGIISFFAWTAGAATTFAVGGLSGETNDRFNDTTAWTVGLVFGAFTAAGLTTLDAWMARAMKPKPRANITFAPAVAPIRGGVVASLGGAF